MHIVIQLIFWVLAAFIVGAAVMVVRARNIIHAALWLIGSFFGVAALYLLLQAEFLAIVQVLVYIGAISILMLFAIMLTHHITSPNTIMLTQRWQIAAGIAALTFTLVLVPTLLNNPLRAAQPLPDNTLAGSVDIGTSFMKAYLLPFEVGAVILLVALVGAIVIAYEERSRRRRVLTLAEEVAMKRHQHESARASNASNERSS